MIPEDAWPKGERLSWADDDNRVVWDFVADPHESRPYTAEENAAADQRAAAAEAVRVRRERAAAARNALVDNQAFLDLGVIGTLQSTAQVKALTRQMNVVIRLMLDEG